MGGCRVVSEPRADIFRGATIGRGLLVGASAPFSYMAGERFGAVVIPSYENLAVLGLVWFIVYYALFSLTKHVNGEGGEQDNAATSTQSV